MDRPTKKQIEVLDVLYEARVLNVITPTYRELADTLGLRSLNSLNDRISSLIDKGILTRDSRKSRSLTFTAKGLNFMKTKNTPSFTERSDLYDRLVAVMPPTLDAFYAAVQRKWPQFFRSLTQASVPVEAAMFAINHAIDSAENSSGYQVSPREIVEYFESLPKAPPSTVGFI